MPIRPAALARAACLLVAGALPVAALAPVSAQARDPGQRAPGDAPMAPPFGSRPGPGMATPASLTAGRLGAWHAVPSAGKAAAQPAAAAPAAGIRPPVNSGGLRISGTLRDGSAVTAAGLSWRPGRLPRGGKLLSFEVSYYWLACTTRPVRCRAAADSTVTPFAARSYVAGHRDTGRVLRLRETATEVVETRPATFTFVVVRATRIVTTRHRIAAFPQGRPPRSEFVNGTPEAVTASDSEYFQVSPPHYSAADGVPAVRYRIDSGRWLPLPPGRVFYTGRLRLGTHRVQVRTANAAGSTAASFRWRVVRLPAPVPCASRRGRACWLPPHLDRLHHPMRWDWQIGVVTPVQRKGASAVDIYDVDAYTTTRAAVRAIRTRWQARTLPHPKAVCYVDVSWEDYRPNASPAGYGGQFPARTLGNVYYGYPLQRWLDFRQLGALKPMLNARIRLCAQKGFDAVEIDDIDSFDPPTTSGFQLTPGDAQNFLAYLFNEIHRHGMAALWKNEPLLSWWGRKYTDGAIAEECYISNQCIASQFAGSRQYGLTCTRLQGPTPCGWDAFTTDRTPGQPTGKWVGEAEYAQDGVVCNPGQNCSHRRHQKNFGAFCRAVYAPSWGFTAVKFSVNLDGSLFYPCPAGT